MSLFSEAKLIPDYFLDEDPKLAQKEIDTTPKPGSNLSVEKVFDKIKLMINDDLVRSTAGVFSFEVVGDSEGRWYLDLKNEAGSAGKGEAPHGTADCTMKLSSIDFVSMFTGRLNPTAAFMQGKLKISGNLSLAMKLEKLMVVMKSQL